VRRADRPLRPVGQALWDFTLAEGASLLPKTFQI
jgi:hypothetical protein